MIQKVETPIDSRGEKVYNTELKGESLARYVRALTSSSLITLGSSTTFVKIYAIAQDVYLKWAETDTDYCKATNFDEVIIAGTQRVFPVPLQVDGELYSRMMFVGRVAGSTVVVIEK